MPKLIARWNRARDVWETLRTGLFCEHSDVFSETWPTSGTTVAGTAYELPTSVPRTGGSVSSSLPTPTAGDHRAGPTYARGNPTLVGAIETLLPTPTADHSRGLPQPGTDYASLPNAVLELLPTPQAHDAVKGKTSEQVAAMRARGHGVRNLNETVENLLPTPTATPYGSNQSPSSGAAVPSLDSLFLLPTPRATRAGSATETVELLPTPTAGDSVGTGYATSFQELTQAEGRHHLRDAANVLHRTRIGASTGPPSPDGNEPSGD